MAETLGQPDRIGLGTSNRQRHEFFAAVAANRVLAAKARLQTTRQLAQDLVAGHMPVAIVDRLEMIDVDHHERDRKSTDWKCAIPPIWSGGGARLRVAAATSASQSRRKARRGSSPPAFGYRSRS